MQHTLLIQGKRIYYDYPCIGEFDDFKRYPGSPYRDDFSINAG